MIYSMEKNSKISRLILGGFKILKIMIKNLRLLIFLDMERVSLTIITLKGGIKMTIKMIAVDMDGTFLNDEKKYNVVQFNQIFQVLEEKKIKFVVASGNQYFQLRSFFPSHYERMAFVAENGANILIGRKHIYNAEIPSENIKKTLAILEKLQPKNLILCGKKSAYISETISDSALNEAKFYYPVLKKIANLYDIGDEGDAIFKLALSFDEEDANEKLHILKKSLTGILIPVSSGHGDIDLILPGVHKLNGLKILGEKWGIGLDEMATFGDSGNDLEMIRGVKNSFAMENAQQKIKEAATTVIGTNNSGAVLDTIQSLIN